MAADELVAGVFDHALQLLVVQNLAGQNGRGDGCFSGFRRRGDGAKDQCCGQQPANGGQDSEKELGGGHPWHVPSLVGNLGDNVEFV